MDAQSSRRPRRKPLGDLSNAPSLSSTATAYKSKLRPRNLAISCSSASTDVPVFSASCSSPAGSTSRIGLQSSYSSVCGAINFESNEHTTLNMVQREDKEKDVEKDDSAISAVCCPPLKKYRITGRMKQVGGSLPSTYSVPCQKKRKRKRRIESTEYELPQDFINEQRAYFEEVDAFELCEELISDSEL